MGCEEMHTMIIDELSVVRDRIARRENTRANIYNEIIEFLRETHIARIVDCERRQLKKTLSPEVYYHLGAGWD